MSRGISVNLDKVIIRLLCWYAFFIPLEHILNVFFGIDTVLKPYRLLAILITMLFLLRCRFRWTPNPEIAEDRFFYIVFIYGAFITSVRMITNSFNMGLLINDSFQLVIYLSVFLVIRHMALGKKEIMRILSFLVAGVVVNSIYSFYTFVILKQLIRSGGFMDNPNYLAFAIQVTIVFMVIKFVDVKSMLMKLLSVVTIFFLGYVFILSGSRTGFFLLVASFILMLYFSPVRVKGLLIAVMIGVGVFVGLTDLEETRSTSPLILVLRLQKATDEDNRIPIWKGTIRAAESTSFSGLGIGQFKGRFREFYPNEDNVLIQRAIEKGDFLSTHNDFLFLFVIYGIVGLLSYLIFMLLSLRKVFLKFLMASDVFSRQYYQFGFLMIISLLLFGMANDNFISPLFWIVLSLSTRAYFEDDFRQEKNLIIEE